MTVPDTQDHTGRRIAGVCLIVVGGLVAVSCGLTIVIVCGAAAMTSFEYGQGTWILVLLTMAFMFTVFGVPTAIGVVMIVFGWRMFHRPRPIPPPENTFV